MSKKDKTYDQAEAMQAKAVRFTRDVVGDPDKADEIESLSVEEYADRKGLQLMNPADERQPIQANRSNRIMADQDENNAELGSPAPDYDTWNKPDLVEECETMRGVIGEVWDATPNDVEGATREELEDALNDVLEIISDYDGASFILDSPDDQEEEAA